MPDAKRPPAVDLVADLPTPAVDDCPTPVLAAITGLNKVEVDRPLHELDLGIKTPHGKARKKTDAFVSPIAFGPFSPRRMRTQTTGSKHPKSLPPPFVLQPSSTESHHATIIMLHGFTSSGKQLASGWLPALARRLGKQKLGTLKLVFLNAPVRTCSCYGDKKPRHPAWHDYFTDHGGEDGRPDIEEEIDVSHLEWCRGKIHAIIDEEAKLLGGDYSRVAIGGASQGCCVALDAALTHERMIAGCFASFGHVYSATSENDYPEGRNALRIDAFHGAGDRCIALSLAMRCYADLSDAGFDQMQLHVEPGLTHCEPSDAESMVFARALQRWGLLTGVEGPPAERLRRRPRRIKFKEAGKPAPPAVVDLLSTPDRAAAGIAA